MSVSGYLVHYLFSFFRHHFVRMCTSMKVDPLASSKGCWTDILGLGEYYFQLAVIVAEVALQRRGSSGGVIALCDILKILRGRRALRDVSEEDIRKAVSKLSVLGNGFRLAEVSTHVHRFYFVHFCRIVFKFLFSPFSFRGNLCWCRRPWSSIQITRSSLIYVKIEDL
jgi:hypothetical protein